MKKTFAKTAAACGLCLTLLASSVSAGAAYNVGVQNRLGGNASFGQQTAMFGGQQNSQPGGMMQGGQSGQMQSNVTYASSAGEIVTGTTADSAASLTADYSNAETITMSDSNSQVKITEAGTYIITGTCSDGNITVKKGTTGVVLVLQDLNLTSTTGATLSVNKGAEAQIIISGSVTLTDAEDSANEDSDDYDGAAISSANNGGDAGLDYDGQLYVSDEFELNNYSGVTGMGAMGGMMGGMPGQQAQGQQGMDRMSMQNQGMGQPCGMNGNQAAGGMWINGRWIPAWMLQQMMR